MPFDEEDTDQPSVHSQKVGLKNVSSQKSIFDSQLKKPSAEDFNKKVIKIQEKEINNKSRAAELALQFNRAMSDKTLKSNKTVFTIEIEQELLSKMIQLAIEINEDHAEQEGMGSLSWITLLLKTCFYQRDRINSLEYAASQFDKKIDNLFLKIDDLDKKKINE